MGEVLEVRRQEEITFHCQVCDAPQSYLLRIVGRRGEMARVRIAGSAWDHTWTERATEDGYTRVEVIEPPDAPLEGDPAALMAHALSNPIYLRVADR
jgi:hypothetical protein